MKYIFTQTKATFLSIVKIQSIHVKTVNLAPLHNDPNMWEHRIMLDDEWILGRFENKDRAIKEMRAITEFVMSTETLYEVRKESDVIN